MDDIEKAKVVGIVENLYGLIENKKVQGEDKLMIEESILHMGEFLNKNHTKIIIGGKEWPE